MKGRSKSKHTTVVIESDGQTFQVQTIRTRWDSFSTITEAVAAVRAALGGAQKRRREGEAA